MRVGPGWVDACILNLSSRGLGMQAAAPPVRGTYVEISRGRHVLVGCVAWSKGHRFGLRTQDCVAIDAIIREPELAFEASVAAPRSLDYRAAQRTVRDLGERSRQSSRTIQFSFVAMIGVSAGFIAFESVHQVLAGPLTAVSVSLRDLESAGERRETPMR